jgi:hypothetical protein
VSSDESTFSPDPHHFKFGWIEDQVQQAMKNKDWFEVLDLARMLSERAVTIARFANQNLAPEPCNAALFDDVAAFNRSIGINPPERSGWIPDDKLTELVGASTAEHAALQAAVSAENWNEVAASLTCYLFMLANLAVRLGIARKYMASNSAMRLRDASRQDIIEDCELVTTDGFAGWIVGYHEALIEAIAAREIYRVDTNLHAAMTETVDLGRDLNLPLASLWAEVRDSMRTGAELDITGVLRRTGWTCVPRVPDPNRCGVGVVGSWPLDGEVAE